MQKVQLGKTDLHIAPVNLGGNVFGWTLDEKQSFEILDAFAGAGFNFLDTADTYSWWVEGNTGGESETIIGKWMSSRQNRKDVIVATKVGSQNGQHPADISKSYILKTAEESLKRLQTDYIDLYYTHFDDEKTPVEETLSAYEQLIKEGKVRYIGASNLSPDRLNASFEASEKNGLPVYQVLQPNYNLISRSTYENDYAPIAQKHNLAVLPYFALAAGFLTGKYRSEADLSKSQRGGGMKDYLNEKGFAILEALDNVSEKHGMTQATVALSWLLHQPLIAAPIVSATSKSQLETIFQAPELRLDKEDLERLDQASRNR
ncbi:aldo/keto reductase [Dyadobacter crusticola]|uniref:aldo/keto reductase n=1 Tax=Dyadobacter crusticola TaxID=292407 RepID=UPI0004E11ED6|nr:aldo/keto reductase [Dyadobacter crusticola]